MPKHYSIKITGRFGAMRHLEPYADELCHTRRLLPVHLDLSTVSFMKPTAVVGTIMFVDALLKRHRDLRMRFPTDARVLNYLVGIGLPNMLNSLGRADWPEGFPTEATAGLRPVIKAARFTTFEEVESISEEMSRVFDVDLTGLGALLKPCHVVFSELADNVLTHAGGPGYVIAQRFEYKAGPVIDIAVGDTGIGLRKALWRNPELRPALADDQAALTLAMRDGVSGLAHSYRGFGLGHVAAELSSPGRSLSIRSGRADGYWRGGAPVRVGPCREFVGTIVHAMLPC